MFTLHMDGMRPREREGERKSVCDVCMSEIDIEREREKGLRDGYWGKNSTDTRTIRKS